jgi:hypothetical protein
MGGLPRRERPLVFDIREFNHTTLPASVAKSWGKFVLLPQWVRPMEMRAATHRIYSASKVRIRGMLSE